MKYFYDTIFLLYNSPVLLAQDLNSNAVIDNAKREAEKDNYDAALSLLEPLSIRFPENEEIKIYIGCIYSWKKDYTASIEILRPMADRNTPAPDALLAIITKRF